MLDVGRLGPLSQDTVQNVADEGEEGEADLKHDEVEASMTRTKAMMGSMSKITIRGDSATKEGASPESCERPGESAQGWKGGCSQASGRPAIGVAWTPHT